jgi:hypothetical protein
MTQETFDAYQFEKPLRSEDEETEAVADFGPSRTPQEAEAAGIAAAIVLSACKDLKHGSPQDVANAQDWLTCDNDGEGAFFWCADVLGIPRQRLRKTILAWHANGCPGADVLRSGRGQQTVKDRRVQRSMESNDVGESSEAGG